MGEKVAYLDQNRLSGALNQREEISHETDDPRWTSSEYAANQTEERVQIDACLSGREQRRIQVRSLGIPIVQGTEL